MAVAAPQLGERTERQRDARLIARIKQGDEAAFAELYKRYARQVASVVYRLLGDDSHLDDIVQETFVISLRQIEQLREPDALGRWLSTIAVRRVQRLLRTRYRSRTMRLELRAFLPQVSDAQERERVHALYRALGRLPDKQRIPWILHHIEGETLPVVAELCGCSLTSVKRYIAKAEKRLRRWNYAG